jgi:uncharacterized protein (TIGR02996 family)
MADREEVPRSHVIEPARSGRSTCATCGKPIVDGELRLSEAYVTDDGKWARAHRNARYQRHTEGLGGHSGGPDIYSVKPDVWTRFHHLTCAAQHQPYKLQSALAGASEELANRAELEAMIQRALSSVDAAEENPETRDEYTRFIATLREGPDEDLQLVFGDWLQSVGDPRGELVSLQHAVETATGEDKLRLVDRERKLLAANRKQLLPDRLEGTLVWRRGFVHRLVLTSFEAGTLEPALGHPSMRLLRELAAEVSGWSSVVIAPNLPPLPATLRVLELSNTTSTPSLGAIGPVLDGQLPQLVRLSLHGAAELDDVRHPTLAELELGCGDATAAVPATPRGTARSLAARIAAIDCDNLPELKKLVVRAAQNLDAAVAALAGWSIIGKLHTLVLVGDVSARAIDMLVDAGARFEVLDVRGTAVANDRRLPTIAKQVVTDEPVAAPAPAKIRDWLVRHTRKPEWGIGRVVEETDAGLRVEFEHAGTKDIRNVELLEEIES